jgi:hypothetical protein
VNVRILVFAVAGGALLLSWCASFVLWRAAERGDEIMQLEARAFGPLEVVAVGTGTAYENPTRRGPCIAVGAGDEVWLVDTGRGVAEGLRAAAIPVAQPKTVLLTSLLPENTTGLDDLLLTGLRQGREQPLRLIGPRGTLEFARALQRAHAPAAAALAEQLALDPAGATFEVVEADSSFREERAGLTITAGEIPGGPLPGLAWSFQRNANRIVVAGTGWGTDALVAFSDGDQRHRGHRPESPGPIPGAGKAEAPAPLRLPLQDHRRPDLRRQSPHPRRQRTPLPLKRRRSGVGVDLFTCLLL